VIDQINNLQVVQLTSLSRLIEQFSQSSFINGIYSSVLICLAADMLRPI